MVHNEIGRRILNRLAGELTEVALVEVPPRQEGMTMVQILGPKKEAPGKAPKAKKAAKDGEEHPVKKPRTPKAAKPAAAAEEKAESGE
jgi:translation initiation factor IF-3